MPGEKRRIDPGVIRRLRDEPYRFEFFQAVRLLLGWYRKKSTDRDQDVLGQVIRFRSSMSLAFPPSEIESLRFESTQDQASVGEVDGLAVRKPTTCAAVTLTPSFIGLTGPLGVLPRHYTQHIAEREIYHRDTATRAFLDIFSTRVIALFYQSWLKYRLHLQYECDRENRFLPMVLSFAGLGLPGMRKRLSNASGEVADESLAYYAGALRDRPQSVQWFSRIVTDYFHVACRIEQFIGQWFSLPENERTHLGTANSLLGQTALCGSRIWDRQMKVRLTLGPMCKDRFNAFLPGGDSADSLKLFFRLMIGPLFDCEVRLLLDRRDVIPAGLGCQADTRLGWNGWIDAPEKIADLANVAYLIKAE